MWRVVVARSTAVVAAKTKQSGALFRNGGGLHHSSSNSNSRTIRKSSSTSSSSSSPPLLWLTVATIALLPPLITLTDARPESKGDRKQQQRQQQQKTNCHSYGCPFLPQDIFFDKAVNDALAQIRASTIEPEYDSAMNLLSQSGDDQRATLTLIGYKGGTLESQINQDRALVVDPYFPTSDYFTTSTSTATADDSNDDDNSNVDDLQTNRLLGVFDGHAYLGEQVSEYTVQELPKLLSSKLSKELTVGMSEAESTRVTKKILVETFRDIDKTAPAEVSGGCTASIILQLGPKIFVANAGDSRSFIVCHHKASDTTEVVYISREDKVSLPDERARIEAMGGIPYIPHRSGQSPRVLYTDPKTGEQIGLAMSRSIGDWDAGEVGVIPDPLVDVLDLPELVQAHLTKTKASWMMVVDEQGEMKKKNKESSTADDDLYIFAVSASDGLLDYVEPEIISKLLAQSIAGDGDLHLLSACERLISIAATAWHHAKQGRYRDDISIAVSKIRSPKNNTNKKK